MLDNNIPPHGILHSLLSLLDSKPIEYQAAPPTDSRPNSDKYLNTVRYLESRGQKNPYGFSQPSGQKTQGNALGAYQVTEGELGTYGSKFLGRPVTKQEFLSNPELQDQYMQKKFDHMNELGIATLPELLAVHRGGLTNPQKAVAKYGDYVKTGVDYYNSINK